VTSRTARFTLAIPCIALALCAAAPALAQAVSCGTTIYGPVSLTADLVCPAGVDGLVIGVHNLRIDLNGYAITSPNAWPAWHPVVGFAASRSSAPEGSDSIPR
jgi:hypothetical protein